MIFATHPNQLTSEALVYVIPIKEAENEGKLGSFNELKNATRTVFFHLPASGVSTTWLNVLTTDLK